MEVFMVDPLIFITNALVNSAKNGNLFYISLSLFCFEFLLGTLYLLWLSTFPKLKMKAVKWINGFYKICFLFDLFLCVTHSLYSQKFAAEISAVLLTCIIKYMLLIALYGLICAHKWVLNERKKDANTLKSKNTAEQLSGVNGFNLKNKDCSPLSVNEQSSDLISGLADVNVAYLRAVINALKSRNLTDEEMERLCNLEFSLKAPLNSDCEAIKKLNGECEYLIKKMTEYGVSV
jgi:hypothetical protein